MNNVIETKNIVKNYGRLAAVDGVSLSVRKGEIYGFLGLNGAGKTTTIKLLLGMIRPDAGEASILGARIGGPDRSLWNRVGYMVEIPYSYPELTVLENIQIFCRLRGIKDDAAARRVAERLHLSEYGQVKACNLSQGNAQRLGLAKALLHQPEVLILDEPSNGLDPAGIVEIREMLRGFVSEQGMTVLVSSHNLSEISRLATRIGIIHRGKLVRELDADKLETFLRRALLIDTRDRQGTLEYLNSHGLPASINENGLIETADGKAIARPEEISGLLVRAGFPPVMLKVEQEDLETYFLRVIGEKK